MLLLSASAALCAPARGPRLAGRRCPARAAAPRPAASPRTLSSPRLPPPPLRRASPRRAPQPPRAQGSEGEQKTGFGYTRADAIIVSVGLPVAGFAAYAALEAAGVPTQTASNLILVVLVFGITIVWTGSYVARVLNKDMTYAKQLDAYEEAVMQKRLEELPSAELESLMADIEAEKTRKAGRTPDSRL